MFDIVTFGSAVVDVFVDTDLSEKEDQIVYPVGAKILIKELREDIGGGGTNTAVAFSRLGLKTGFIGKVGDDESGRKVLNLLKKEKVKFLGKIAKEGVTGRSIILDSKEKGRTVLTYKGVNDELDFDEIKIPDTKWLYASSLIGKSFVTLQRLVNELKDKGKRFAFNPSDYLIKKYNLKSLIKMCDVLVLNKEEAKLLAGKKKDLLKGLHELGARIVVITDKNNKINAFDGKKKYSLKPNKVHVVERTGAGDAFASGFVTGQIVGMGIQDSLKLGLRESESVIRHFGAKNNLLKVKLK